jgi:hypothetical protein
MSSLQTDANPPLTRGTYAPADPTASRGPCPMINSLANHGYLPRDGRSVRLSDVKSALNEVGIAWTLTAVFAHPIFEEVKASQPPRTLLQKLGYFMQHPWAALGVGMRKAGQFDAIGEPCIDIEQLDLPGVVEHDISLTRRDHQQGDNHTPQADLLEGLLESSSNGKMLTVEDLARYRSLRINEQRKVNPEAKYEKFQHVEGCAETALLLRVFGDGAQVPVDYVRAFFVEERLPMAEGWRKRGWLRSLGIAELVVASAKVWKVIGMKF